MTFSSIIPFLKGMHLTIDSWRPMQDDDGWKLLNKEVRAWLEQQVEEGMSEDAVYELLNSGAPGLVKPVPRFFDALDFYISFSRPKLRQEQPWMRFGAEARRQSRSIKVW
jgi:hypothetical protein